jgi:nucleoside 2-deoxyribosyltransferase
MDAINAAPWATLTHDWLAAIAQAGNANHGLSDPERRDYATADLCAVKACDVLWLLAPETVTRGAWLETGYALALGKRVVVSGNGTQSIFCALGYEVSDDLGAFNYIRSLVSAPANDVDVDAYLREYNAALARNASNEELAELDRAFGR